MIYRRMAVIGIGQIGASFALAAKAAGAIRRVVGVARSQQTRDMAMQVGAADSCTEDLAAAVAKADLVYLAVPVRAMRQVMTDISPALAPGCLVTDAGSTKAEICRWASEILPPEVHFIGGHPMAGTEKHGPASASGSLFANTTYLLCPTQAPQEVADRFRSLVEAIGARPVTVSPDEHDRVLAYSSHLPHLCAAVLSLTLKRRDIENVTSFAGGGLRDTTRIAAADVEMWRDIMAANGSAIVAATEQFCEALSDFTDAVIAEDWEQVAELLAEAKSYRDSLYG